MEAEVNKTELPSADILHIMKLLPHRYPFLLIDRIEEMDGDNTAVGIKNVTMNEHFFQGHFPDFPVMPGVLIIEGMAQTAGALCVHANNAEDKPIRVFFMSIDNAKFRKPVLPGDTLHYHVQKVRHRGTVWKFKCEARVDGKRVAEAEIGAMVAEVEE